MNAREEILERIRTALSDVPASERPEDVPVAREYDRDSPATGEERLARFSERLLDYHAAVRSVSAPEAGSAVAEACAAWGLRRVVIPPALPGDWRPHGVEVIEDRDLSASELDAIDGVITGCAAAIAATGTVILDGGGACGRRAISLVPDHHICVVGADQLVASVPAGLARVAGAARAGRPITLISGPSASSDIELTRVEGVHGPRNLLVIVLS